MLLEILTVEAKTLTISWNDFYRLLDFLDTELTISYRPTSLNELTSQISRIYNRRGC